MEEIVMKRVMQNERGMALAVAIFMLVIVGALVAGALFVGTQDQRSSENTRRLHQSFGIAELGAFDQVRGWNVGWGALTPYPITASTAYPAAGSTATISQTAIAGMGSYSGTVYHMNQTQYLFDITGGDTLSQAGAVAGGGARQRLGILVRAIPANTPVSATVATRGGTGQLRGGYQASGNDVVPAGWTGCGPLQPAIPGFETNDSAAYMQNKNNFKNVTGTSPSPVKIDPSLTASDMDTLGTTAVTYAQLVARANITLAGGTYAPAPVITSGVCTKTVLTNWGSPLTPAGACGDYFPVIHITGDLRVNGIYQGQGILLIDGNFAPFDFTFMGLVMVQGAIDSTHHFYLTGGMQVKNQNNHFQDIWDIIGNYSSCALARAFMTIPTDAAPFRSRGWVELY
jgi:hypothetical protein